VKAKESVLGRDHPDVYGSLWNLGSALQLAGRYGEALAVDSSTEALFAKSLGPDHVKVGHLSNNRGEVLNLLGRHGDAAQAFQKSLEIFRLAGADRDLLSYALTGLARANLGEGRPREAIPLLEEALHDRVEAHADSEHLGETRFALARALWSRLDQRDHARTLARQALADYAEVKVPTAPVPDVAAWLRAPAAAHVEGP